MKKTMGLISLALLMNGCSNTSANDEKLLVSAASSLTDVMKEMELQFHEIEPNIELTFNYGSSSKLRSQIEQGAPSDLFLSASEKDMELLESQQLIDIDSIKPFAENQLVLASLEEFPETTDFQELVLNTEEKIAIGEPDSVPLGAYSKKALENENLWNSLSSRLIYAKDARQVVTYVESGNAELGIIYSSDAVISREINGTLEVPGQTDPIIYPGAVIADSENQPAATAFWEFVTSSKGQAILKEYGFMPIAGETP
ncbi:molybdenum ABC transporter, periplasmic molybdenum-binding protein ModA [Planococcus halocryophilus Or1]|uniref:Molybdate ABC transporter substrate-binding protein n=1 Tax=Planococcus halocryophilus TaxID=1215089 RepID=A0A1C7DSY0_9BACL|nr:molybdate ABC transporter substrate-binding protein [Planococcus halocryophilus]ANU14381.1 molybdate ABC transporter substrate-binding protein [Planococcus halocryophilus]EMF46121.1 molybdenum ABC transporter, periplasmic molybdenum-binding protein ModA [Planococcus halocryophilus Or1]